METNNFIPANKIKTEFKSKKDIYNSLTYQSKLAYLLQQY